MRYCAEKGDSCLEGQLRILHNWVSTCLSGCASPKCSQEPLLSVLPGCGLAVGLHYAQFCTSIPFLTVCYFCFSAFLKRSSNPVLQFSLTFSFLKNHVFFHFICPAHTIFCCCISRIYYTNILVPFISSNEGHVLETLKYMFHWLNNLYISSLALSSWF